MATGGLPPLSVDPAQLNAAGGALLTAAGQLPAAPPPFAPIGSDPLSTAIIGQIPAVETPIMTELPLIQTQATATAQNVVDSAQAYAATDQQNGAAINEVMQKSPSQVPTAGGGGSGPSGGGADPMSQMMGMPMQMAQMPMQMMGALAAVPQGAMQGVQQVGQQVQQMAGQFGQGATGGSTGANPGTPPQSPAVNLPSAEENGDGAAAGEPEAERAPAREDEAGEDTNQTPGRHRAAEPSDRIDL